VTIRDYQASFTDTSSGSTTTVFGAAGTYIAPNSYDTSPLSSSLTELTAADTTLAGNSNTYRDFGGGDPLWLVINWTTAVNTLTSVKMQLITSATSDLATPTVMYDFGAVVIASLVKGFRQIARLPRSTAWLQWIGLQAVTVGSTGTTGAYVGFLCKDVDAVDFGAASGFSIK